MRKPEFLDKLKPDWSSYSRMPPWHHITSRELAKVFGVHLQTISNYVCRGFLIPEPKKRFKGNKNYFRISYIQSLFENKSIEEIEWAWINKYIEDEQPFDGLEQAQYVIRVCHNIYGVDKPLV
jgi:hypothetical protein